MPEKLSAVIFDFGGVLGQPQDPVRVRAMADLCGLSVETFLSMYQHDRLELDRGTLSPDDYWGRFLKEGGVAASAGLVARLEDEDSRGWTRINEPIVAWAGALRRAGWRTAILSNMPPDKLTFMRARERFGFIRDFDAVVFSCEHRLVKPEPAIYALCLRQLQVEPRASLFIDDSLVNVDGARAAGMNAVRFHTNAALADEVQAAWGLPVDALRRGIT